MLSNNHTWLGIGIGALLIMAVFVWGKKIPKDSEEIQPESDVDSAEKSVMRKTPIQESIRQIALIEKDEFESFYNPVITRVQEYEKVLSGKTVKRDYFETIYKALRKRRSTIFEYGSSEKDQQKRALWTFVLFSTISIRYIVNRLNDFSYELDGNVVNPMLVDRFDLAKCDLHDKPSRSIYPANLSNIHLIEKVLEVSVIQRFNQTGIYSFLVNAITGFYQDRLNPFYMILEQVENHVQDNEFDEDVMFLESLKLVLGLIERNTFSKNSANSLIFEGMSYLLIDRNFLWELFRMYAVYTSHSLGKKEFEAHLVKALGLSDTSDKQVNFIVSVEIMKLDVSQEKARIKLSNMIALPYKAVSYYRYSDRRRIEKQMLQRDVAIDETVRGLAEHDVVKSAKEINQRSEKPSPDNTPSSVGVNDLFSSQQ